MASLYGKRSSYRPPIYGVSNKIQQCDTTSICMTEILLKTFYALTNEVQNIVETLFPAIVTKATIVTKMKAFAYMNDFTYVRFVWMNRHPGMFFDRNILSLRYEILDIYLEHSMTSWVSDPLVNALRIQN